MQRTEETEDHERFKELSALAAAGSLSMRERLDLERHLETCGACRDIRDQYTAIGAEGMAFLSQNQPLSEEAERWDNSAARERLFSAVHANSVPKVLSIVDRQASRAPRRRLWAGREASVAAAAACLMVAVALGAYRIGEHRNVPAPSVLQSSAAPVQQPVDSDKQAFTSLLAADAAQISKLREQISQRDQELARLRTESGLADIRISDLSSLNREAENNLRQLTAERDKLVSQLGAAENAYQKLQADFNVLKTDHNRSLLHEASLASDITSLTAQNRDQDRRVKDAEQYLVSDRDIRELMGARKLYIADVFDVDSASRTRKPFGRVFYTQNKSLVFYAFDLDHQPDVKNASDFQVWGQRDSESNGASHPMNLGILYMDSESNRRWVLRSDDPRQLAEIDAVFVTIEPHGGSQKPTGKPLLYALLRKEANHP
jgi:anti-sigma-K factor RskA